MKTIFVEDLPINEGTYNALKNAGIDTANELHDMTDTQLLSIHEIGPVRRKIIKNALATTRGVFYELPVINW
jgi:DNA-directed RNA polymerase alpha subunit|tara:strand:+ start:78 stop:293 length:216 start_codon:yes stop_codon:yes gene_type:complete